MTSTTIADQKFERGQKTSSKLVLGPRSCGSDLSIPINLVIGAKEGPRLTLVFCQHGDEWSPLKGWKDLFQGLDPTTLAGEIVTLPAANPVAFEFKMRNSWMDALGGHHGNLNRAWPGQADGWLTERIAHLINTEILQDSDCVIDFHDGTPGNLHIFYGFLSADLDGDYGTEMERLGKGFGMEILVSKSLPLEGTLTGYLTSERILNIGVEIGHFHGFDGDAHVHADYVTARGIKNVMKMLEMQDGVPDLPSKQAIVQPETRVKPMQAGLLNSFVTGKDIGQIFKQDECLFEMVDISSMESIERVHGPYDENFLLTAPGETVVINPGDHGCHVADGSTLQWIHNSRN